LCTDQSKHGYPIEVGYSKAGHEQRKTMAYEVEYYRNFLSGRKRKSNFLVSVLKRDENACLIIYDDELEFILLTLLYIYIYASVMWRSVR
jgi:hypothetical protein